MSRQMPELYLRGAIFNETMKNLSQKQMNDVEGKINILLKTPSLTKSREKFCQTLAVTIGADYREDKNAALQEYKIALMKAVIYVMYHKPNMQVFDDPIQTRKLFSQFTYNYMKQILNENKIPKSVCDKHIEGDPFYVAYEQIISLLEEEKILYTSEFDENKYIIDGDIGIISLRTARKIGKIKEKYAKMGVIMSADIGCIEIEKKKSSPSVKMRIRSASRIHVVNFEHEANDESDLNRNNIEFEISKRKNVGGSDFDPSYMRQMLPNHLMDLFDVITDSPEGLSEEPNKNEIAKHLGITINEVNKRLNQMKYYYYCTAKP